MAEGLTNGQIAERLVISEHTAIRHVANVFRKLGAGNRAAAVRLGAERGLIAPDMAGPQEANSKTLGEAPSLARVLARAERRLRRIAFAMGFLGARRRRL